MEAVVIFPAALGVLAVVYFLYVLFRFMPVYRWDRRYEAMRFAVTQFERMATESGLAGNKKIKVALIAITGIDDKDMRDSLAVEFALQALNNAGRREIESIRQSVNKIGLVYRTSNDDTGILLSAILDFIVDVELQRRKAPDEERAMIGGGLLARALTILWPKAGDWQSVQR